MGFAVRFSQSARDDLLRLHDFLLARCETIEDLASAERAIDALVSGTAILSRTPFVCRKAGSDPHLRELLVPFGRSGYVLLFEIDDASTITVHAVRHQLEDDYH